MQQVTSLCSQFEQYHFTTYWYVKRLLDEKKWYRLWSDATYGIWSGSTLFAQACLSQYLRQMCYQIYPNIQKA